MTAATATAEAVEEFLRKCEASGDEAYGAFRSVLEKLEDPSSRTQARVFLSDLQKRVDDSDECLNKYHFRIQDVVLDQYEDSCPIMVAGFSALTILFPSIGYQGRKKLTMMVIPSIFIPEDWSFTFYEGLNRHPDSILKDKTVAELGCGNGWITIAIAEKWLPSKILNPNPDAMSKIITENASEEFLYSLSNYCALQNVVVFPSRAVAIENALRLFSPRLAIVDEHLTRHLPKQWLTSLTIKGTDTENSSEHELTVIEAPRQSDLMVELIKKLKPQVVISGIGDFEAVTSSAFVHLLDVTREVGSHLFLDISDHFELSSLPSSNGVLKYLAGNVLPSHAAVICGLVKNQVNVFHYTGHLTVMLLQEEISVFSDQVIRWVSRFVYSDLEVAFVISEEEAIFKALSKTVEVLEGTTALISQNYYGCLFHELLAFQLAERHTHKEVQKHMNIHRDCEKAKSTEMIGFSRSAISVLNSAELSITETPNSGLIHMDVDQSFLPIPSLVKAAIFESFARQNMSESEIDVTPSIQQYIKSNFGFPIDINAEFIYADCSQSLFNKLVLCCILEGGTLCFPAGSNGNYVSAARFLKANIVNIPTESEVGFKMTEKTLVTILETVKKPWVYISGPTINPTGLLYSNKEMENILTYIIFELYYSILNICPTIFSMVIFLQQALENCGWEVVQSCSGVSMVAKPSAYLNKTVKISRHSAGSGEKTATEQIKLDDSNIREAIVKATGLCINSGSWTGIPGYCRFTIALEESEFERALDCIAKFKSIVHVVN
ncbi:hypothetical protein CUMW_219970 [Citrus unshiu]|uniref:Aminotransferase class I/classII large domain-containing protein n=1 Tax=Citrus unshiu TaxID=55188 RepID=A0A2H5QDJ8_CITUN|nr:hypothetical protein CUMW_219970 [Citrus unshiu]